MATTSSYIVVNASEGDAPKVYNLPTLAKASEKFREVARKDLYYPATVTIFEVDGFGEAQKVEGWSISYADGEFYNVDTRVSVDMGDVLKGDSFPGEELAPLFPAIP